MALAAQTVLIDRRPVRYRLALTALVLSLQALVYVQTRFTGLGISVYQPVSWPAVAALVAFWVGAVFALRRVDRRAAKGDP